MIRRKEIKIRYERYGMGYYNLWGLIKAIIKRQMCSLRGHPQGGFHSATGIEWQKGFANGKIGVTFVCPKCHKIWAGDISSCMPINELIGLGLKGHHFGY